MIRGVCFDFDGTLAPNLDLPGMRAEVIDYTRATGVPDVVWEGNYIVEIVDAAQAYLAQTSLEHARRYYAEAHRIILRVELDAAATTAPFPGVESYLTSLRERDIRIGVVTRNCRQAVMLTFPNILDHVDVLHARDDVPFFKPDPRHLADTLEVMGVQAAQAAMVGDGAIDMKVGRQSGLYCVGVLSGSSDRQALKDAGADEVHPSCLDYRPDRRV